MNQLKLLQRCENILDGQHRPLHSNSIINRAGEKFSNLIQFNKEPFLLLLWIEKVCENLQNNNDLYWILRKTKINFDLFVLKY